MTAAGLVSAQPPRPLTRITPVCDEPRSGSIPRYHLPGADNLARSAAMRTLSGRHGLAM
jgi:hypothetical protein